MAKDIIHDAVKNALVKGDWRITDDPLTIYFDEDTTVFVDLGAEQIIAAEQNGDKIAVEIKSFVGRSSIRDMEIALGQYTLYLSFLEKIEPDRKLYVAISQAVFESVFRKGAFQYLVERNQIPLIIVNIDLEEIVQWIKR
jgi:hypothetical protein